MLCHLKTAPVSGVILFNMGNLKVAPSSEFFLLG